MDNNKDSQEPAIMQRSLDERLASLSIALSPVQDGFDVTAAAAFTAIDTSLNTKNENLKNNVHAMVREGSNPSTSLRETYLVASIGAVHRLVKLTSPMNTTHADLVSYLNSENTVFWTGKSIIIMLWSSMALANEAGISEEQLMFFSKLPAHEKNLQRDAGAPLLSTDHFDIETLSELLDMVILGDEILLRASVSQPLSVKESEQVHKYAESSRQIPSAQLQVPKRRHNNNKTHNLPRSGIAPQSFYSTRPISIEEGLSSAREITRADSTRSSDQKPAKDRRVHNLISTSGIRKSAKLKLKGYSVQKSPSSGKPTKDKKQRPITAKMENQLQAAMERMNVKGRLHGENAGIHKNAQEIHEEKKREHTEKQWRSQLMSQEQGLNTHSSQVFSKGGINADNTRLSPNFQASRRPGSANDETVDTHSDEASNSESDSDSDFELSSHIAAKYGYLAAPSTKASKKRKSQPEQKKWEDVPLDASQLYAEEHPYPDTPQELDDYDISVVDSEEEKDEEDVDME